jgi:hypothetical protein
MRQPQLWEIRNLTPLTSAADRRRWYPRHWQVLAFRPKDDGSRVFAKECSEPLPTRY